MLSELKTIEAQLKQILYGCVEHVQATKAALYLSSSHDLNAKLFEVVTSYQYNVADRRVVSANDDLVDRMAVKRSPFYINGLGTDQRFAEMLFRQGNDRLLVTPLFSRGRMVGFIDMRDKAGKKPFDLPDVEAAKKIADQMLGVLASNKLFGLGAIALVEDPTRPLDPANVVRATPEPATPRPAQPGQVFSPEALRAIEAARQYLSKRQLVAPPSGKRAIVESDLDVLRLLLPSALGIPYAVAACVSVMGQLQNPQAVAARSGVSDDAMNAIEQHLQAGLKRANQPHATTRIEPSMPFGTQNVPITAANLSAIVTAPLNAQTIEGLLVTVAFDRITEVQAQRGVQLFVKSIEPFIEAAFVAASGRQDRQMLAERILEPDFQKLPHLAEHCRSVSEVSRRFAKALGLPATQIETVRLAALVHDAGLRLIDYDRLYKRPTLTAEEMRGFAEHPVVGAALVEPILGSDVAQAVLRHHERVDGKGYPSRMSGSQIPLASRILQVADAWIAMTSERSYQPALAREHAVAKLREGAGTQFDAALIERFLAMLPAITA
jgi:HD-GYP domain-containing protein (c-di-GMP phosphodiesterase class II)